MLNQSFVFISSSDEEQPKRLSYSIGMNYSKFCSILTVKLKAKSFMLYTCTYTCMYANSRS